MSKILTTSEVTVQTLTVDVAVVRIGKKQMTLSVFRQLEVERLIDPATRQLRGVPWGRVRYHNHCPEREHLHIVWQKGRELRQDLVYKDCKNDYEIKQTLDRLGDDSSLTHDAGVLRYCLTHEPVRDWKKNSIEIHSPYGSTTYHYQLGIPAFWDIRMCCREVRQLVDDFTKRCEEYYDPPSYTEEYCNDPSISAERRAERLRLGQLELVGKSKRWTDCRQKLQDDLRVTLKALRAEYDLPNDTEPHFEEALKACKKAILKKQQQIQVEYATRYAELAALDQLFIAV